MVNADYLKQLMKAHNYSIGQLSIKSGLSKSQISRILRGERGAGSKTMIKILKAFPEADPNKLFFLPINLQKREEKEGRRSAYG